MSFNPQDSSDVFWRPRLGYYSNKSKNGMLYVDNDDNGNPDPSKPIKATSYGWWIFFLKLDNGQYVFNDYRFSSQTGSHQRGVKEVLKKLNISYIQVNTKAHLGEPDQVLYELQEHLYTAEKDLAFTFTKRCKPRRYGGTVEDRRKWAAEAVEIARAELHAFNSLFLYSAGQLEHNQKKIEQADKRRREAARVVRRVDSESRSKIEKAKRKALAESWDWERGTPLEPYSERPMFDSIDRTGDQDVTNALVAFLTTDTMRERIGNYFIDGDKLCYRVARYDRHAKNGTPITVREAIIARKVIEGGRMIIVGNSSKLKTIGSYVAYGNEVDNYEETEVQKRLQHLVTMIPFDEFRTRDPRQKNIYGYGVKLIEIPMTIKNITIFRLTGKVPGKKEAA